MSNKADIKPTEAELEILQIIWADGPSTVRQVNEKLNAIKSVGYTTTLKIMQIMTEKGLVSRERDSRTHIYSSAIDQEVTQRALLTRFLENTFSGSASSLVMQALGNHSASPGELNKIKELIKQLEEKNGDIDR